MSIFSLYVCMDSGIDIRECLCMKGHESTGKYYYFIFFCCHKSEKQQKNIFTYARNSAQTRNRSLAKKHIATHEPKEEQKKTKMQNIRVRDEMMCGWCGCRRW